MNRIKQIIDSVKETVNFNKAFVHTSYQNELKLDFSYEALEFLGDSVLNFYTTLFIYNKFPAFSEGQMSKLKQLMVKESTLAEISRKINLHHYLQLGEGEKKNGGFEKVSILADIFESFIGALYLERGGRIVFSFLNGTLFKWSRGKEMLTWDYKTKLQEYCQSEKNAVCYRLLSSSNSSCGGQFVVEVKDLLGKFVARGTGGTKKKAEQEAAYNAMKELKLLREGE